MCQLYWISLGFSIQDCRMFFFVSHSTFPSVWSEEDPKHVWNCSTCIQTSKHQKIHQGVSNNWAFRPRYLTIPPIHIPLQTICQAQAFTARRKAARPFRRKPLGAWASNFPNRFDPFGVFFESPGLYLSVRNPLIRIDLILTWPFGISELPNFPTINL